MPLWRSCVSLRRCWNCIESSSALPYRGGGVVNAVRKFRDVCSVKPDDLGAYCRFAVRVTAVTTVVPGCL